MLTLLSKGTNAFTNWLGIEATPLLKKNEKSSKLANENPLILKRKDLEMIAYVARDQLNNIVEKAIRTKNDKHLLKPIDKSLETQDIQEFI
jgi:uncharacterized protein YpiB (UPF0302 family)